jgi:hypothetical protein
MKTEEIRHSLGGSAIESIKQIIDDTEFLKCNAFCRGRDYTKNETIMTKFMYLEHILWGSITSDIMNDNSLYNMVKTYTTQTVSPAMINTIERRISVLISAFEGTKNVLMPQLPMLYCSYLLAAHLQDNATLTDTEIATRIKLFADYVKDLRTDFISAIKDYDHVKEFTEDEHRWYKMTMENFGKRGTAKSEVHIYTEWFKTVLDQYESKFGKNAKKKTLKLFH